LVAAGVSGDAFAVLEELHRGGGQAHLECLVDQALALTERDRGVLTGSGPVDGWGSLSGGRRRGSKR
jgi:hypothetical protein